jgi:hypothetical protein
MRWYRWLRPGGYLTIETPDFEGCIANFAGRPIDDRAVIIRHIFGSQEAPWAQHRDGWSPSRFRYVLGELGFTQISTTRSYSDTGHLLPNVTVTAHRPIGDGSALKTQIAKALDILRQSMVDAGRGEQILFERWRLQFEALWTSGADPK